MKEMPIAPLSRRELIRRVMTSYGIGMAVPALLISIPHALLSFPIIFLFGSIAGLPVLFVALIVTAMFQVSINRDVGLWCAAAPVLVLLPASAVVVRGFGLPLSSAEAKIYLVMSFVCATVSAASFFKMSRDDASNSAYPNPEVWA